MQQQRVLQEDPAGTQTATIIPTQATGRLRKQRVKHIMLGAIAIVGLVIASTFGIQALIDEQPASVTQQAAPAILAQEDPPLPDGWVDPYFSQPVSIPVQEDPPLPEGWIDPYFQGTD